jgi:hypothetical protein
MNDFFFGALVLVNIINLIVGLVGIRLVLSSESRAGTRFSVMEARVSKLEAYQMQNLTHAETRQIYERLSSIEGQVHTTNRVMQTVQEFLLENDR